MVYGLAVYVNRRTCCITEYIHIVIFFCATDGNTVYAVRNKVPDPSVSYNEVGFNRESCSRTVRGSTNLRVYDDAADKCREYATIIPEQNLIDADRFIAFYPIVGSGPGMCFFLKYKILKLLI